MIEFACPNCGTAISVADSQAGQALTCANCGGDVPVPAAPGTAAALPVQPASDEQVEVSCPVCFTAQRIAASLAGTSVICSNCDSSIPVPEAAIPVLTPIAPPPVAASAVAQGAAVATVVPNLAGAGAASGAVTVNVVMQGPAPQPKSLLLALVFWWFLNGAQYLYFGQTGKGLLLLLVDLVFWTAIFIAFLTIIFAIFVFPIIAIWCVWQTVWLVDTILIHNRLRRGPVSAWRCF
jgi:hypothetical protein